MLSCCIAARPVRRGHGTTTPKVVEGHQKRNEAHIQTTESEAREQTRFPRTHEDSRWEKDPCEAAGSGTRSPRGENRLEIVEWRQPTRLWGRAREEEDSACLARGGFTRRETFDPSSGTDRGRRRPAWTSSFCLHPGQAAVGAQSSPNIDIPSWSGIVSNDVYARSAELVSCPDSKRRGWRWTCW